MNRVSQISRSRPARADAEDGSAPHRYWAYLSYSHRDEADAKWLHAALEKFTVPPGLVGRETAAGPIPKSFVPIFRDRQELAASHDLGSNIREALAGSRFLIVLCSPAAAASHWTNEEIAVFKRLHPDSRVLAAIVAGEPWASLMPGREAEECFPPALRTQFDSRGRATKKRAEPIAADLREGRDGRRMGMLKIAAGMLGVGLDDLVQREAQRRQKRLTYIAAASLAGMTLTSGLAVFAFDKRDEARDQRREAEGLVGFMLGDLRGKLEPIGRLDALDAVGVRALQYFGKQDKSELSDAALAQRSRALALLGEIAIQRGDLDGAMARYREAMNGTAEMMRRAPDDPQRLFDHAQNVFWVGDIALKRGQLDRAEAAMREYMRLANAMVALEPDNRKWRLETKYADTNLGILFYEQRRYPEAARQLERALSTVETLAAADPGNKEYQESVPETLAWLADSQFGEGRLDDAIAKRERQLASLETLSRLHPSDVDYRQRQIPARRALGRLLASQGAIGAGLEQIREAVKIGQELIPTDPDNMQWLRYTAGAQFDLAKILLVDRKVDEAAVQTRAGCDLVNRLAQRDKNNIESLSQIIECSSQRSRVALEKGAYDEALALAGQALRAAKATRGGGPADHRIRIAGAHKLIADIHSRFDNRRAAQSSLLAALAAWPKIAENPREMAIRAAMLKDAGRAVEAKPLTERLNAIGYRRLI